ncbi:MAG: ROK family protein [Planctomycetaceae bacterium]|jgi:glucokinase|nr:ROK family protein [Planctomycetaceae bacterium]
METLHSPKNHYVGVDVGGTKIQASLITGLGSVIANYRCDTPRDSSISNGSDNRDSNSSSSIRHRSVEMTLNAIEESIRILLREQNQPLNEIAGVGVAVPGVVQQETGLVVITPNMNLSGVELGQRMKDRLGVPVAIGNDCNLGTLGECWLGSGRNTSSCVGIFVGTGIGAGIVVENRILNGAGQAAGEIGHIISQIPCEHWRNNINAAKYKQNTKSAKNGLSELPRCGCGNYGCFETFASRTAIERFIREAVARGAKSVITDLNGGTLDIIKSGAIAKAIKANDKVVVPIVRYAAQVIGYACLTVRHLLDPEVIVLGGGVIEACQKFMMPIIDAVVANDQLPSAPGKRRILVSSLGDNAVVLGAVALVRSANGFNPLRKTHQIIPKYPQLHFMAEHVIHIADEPYSKDFFILSDGTIQPRLKLPKKNVHGFRLKDIRTVLSGGVDLIIFGSPHAGEITLSPKCHDYLLRRGIDYRILPLDKAVHLYNTVTVRRAAVWHFS